MRTLLLLSVAALNVIALSLVRGEEPKQPNASRLRLFCSLGKDGMKILPAEPEAAAKEPAQFIIICDSMRLGPNSAIVLGNVTIETKDGTMSAKELALHLDHQGPSISFHSPDGGGIRELTFKPKLNAEQLK